MKIVLFLFQTTENSICSYFFQENCTGPCEIWFVSEGQTLTEVFGKELGDQFSVT